MDTSVWIDHLRSRDPELSDLLDRGQVLCHPFVLGELAVGSLKHRDKVLRDMTDLPQADSARNVEVLQLVSERNLFGQGIGYIDAHLLTSAQITAGALLWTRDKRLNEIAGRFSLSYTAVPAN